MTEFNAGDSPGPGQGADSSSIMSQLHGAGGGDAGEFDLTTASAPGRSLPLQAISVGLVLLVGAGSLYLMRRAGTRAGIDFNTTVVVSAVDTTIKKLDNEDEILGRLAEAPPEQVPKDQVPKNVFEIDRLGAETKTPILGNRDPAEIRRELRRVEIKEALGRLQVESVMHGRVPIAKISGKLYRVGDPIGGKEGDLFTIARIEDRTVHLTVDGEEHDLSMMVR